MNQNFVGAPDREDLRILEQLRRQLGPMISAMESLRKDMEIKMHRGEPVNWPQIHRTTMQVSKHIASFNTFMYGGYKHNAIPTSETRQVPKQDDEKNIIMNEDGTPMLVSKEVTTTTYSDSAIYGQAEKVKALHPFPMPPFPLMQEGMPGPAAGLANTLLRKRMEPKEEEWVEDRLRKATEFAHVPSEWNIEPKRAGTKDEKEDSDSEDEGEDGGDNSEKLIQTKRVKGTLGEDDILDLWKYAHQEVFDQRYLKAKYPEDYDETAGVDDGETPMDDGDAESDEEEDEFEDAMDTSGAIEPSVLPSEAQTASAESAPSVTRTAMRTLLAVHPSVAGEPVQSLGFMQQFISSGE